MSLFAGASLFKLVNLGLALLKIFSGMLGICEIRTSTVLIYGRIYFSMGPMFFYVVDLDSFLKLVDSLFII